MHELARILERVHAVAACGVALLARFHPDARPVPATRETRDTREVLT